ncbi:S9 family peptidase [Parabacteroides chongii]|uniref:S9 family peptidase n=1 Tax=Parabacteroides chongii TaxID=2685834 RepID=UPI00240DBFA6|nr:DPP IV N-terminal domain-containing protein [Parabacteroides chongii]WFE86008.1 DPP IV N-terminal domain-containing protein [Parabacteroides chongii]
MNLKIKIFLVLCVFALSTPLKMMAQDKQFTLHDLIPGGKTYSRFVPENRSGLQWAGDMYIYVEKNIVIGAKPKHYPEIRVSRSGLNQALQAAGLDSVARMPVFSVPYKGQQILAFTHKQHRIHYDMQERKVVADYQLDKAGSNYEFCPANSYLAFTDGNNIKILSPDNQTRIVTRETMDGVVCGQAVHQREFGINKGLFWSPKGSALAFYRMDESMVTDYPIVNIDARCAKAEPQKYPMAGMKSHEVTIGVYNLSNGETVWLQTGTPKEKYLTNIAWSPDEKSIYIAELNRDQNEMHLVRYSALTGEKEADLFTEKNDRYVEPQHPVLFLPNDPEKFIWQSQRDGYNHLYLYDTSGKLLKQLTKGDWIVMNVLGFDPKGENLFITSTQPHPLSSFSYGTPLNINGWRLDMKKGETHLISGGTGLQGVHNLSISPDGKYAIDNYSAPDIPRKIEIVQTKNRKTVETLLTAKNPYEGYALPEIEVGTIKAADGVTDLNYRLVKPVGLDESKKYPAIIYVYGGPHAQLITGDFMNGGRGWDIYMAQRGYVMLTVDSRGSANRGFEFESVIHRNLGVNEMADQVKGADFLKSLPYVDADRIGVHGWSYGGFMTTNLMLSYPEIFKVGVAGGPVIDWSNYEIMYGERYMDRPQDNPEGYKNANMKLKAGNLKGHLLMIHGDIDPVVVWQHSLGFLKACVEADTYPDYFVYPRHQHNVIGKDRPHLYEKITRYFDDYLK